MATKPKKQPAATASTPERVRVVCVQDTRVKGVHFTLGDEVNTSPEDAEALGESGAFRKV